LEFEFELKFESAFELSEVLEVLGVESALAASVADEIDAVALVTAAAVSLGGKIVSEYLSPIATRKGAITVANKPAATLVIQLSIQLVMTPRVLSGFVCSPRKL
jgi:hypothetical protein